MGFLDIFKAKRKALPEEPPAYTPKPAQDGEAFQLDPYDYTIQGEGLGGDVQGVHGLDFMTLRRMSRVPPIAAIIQTRCNQVAEFSAPAEDQFDIGFTVRLKNKTKDPTKAELAEMEEIRSMIATTGPYDLSDDDFDTFLRKLVRDSLRFDQAAFEVLRARNGRPLAFEVVDASTIRRAKVTSEERQSGRIDLDGPAYIQMVQGVKRAEWTRRQVGFIVRRPRSDIYAFRYGYPELEELVEVVTYYLNAFQNNGEKYVNGIHTQGILAFKTKMNPKLFRAFRREFYSMLQGSRNSNKTLLMQLDPDNKEEIQNVNMGASNTDAQYDQWLAFLLKLACSLYQIDPAELGFIYGAEGQSGALSQGGPGERIQYSREKGLRPLLKSIERSLNRMLFQSYQPWDKYRFCFQGFDVETADQRLKAAKEKASTFMTVNEVRQELGLEPLDNPAADKGPLNQVFAQYVAGEAPPPEEGAAEGEGGGAEPGAEAPPTGEVPAGDEDVWAQFFKGAQRPKVRLREVEVDV
jgi:hypothetical protein